VLQTQNNYISRKQTIQNKTSVLLKNKSFAETKPLFFLTPSVFSWANELFSKRHISEASGHMGWGGGGGVVLGEVKHVSSLGF